MQAEPDVSVRNRVLTCFPCDRALPASGRVGYPRSMFGSLRIELVALLGACLSIQLASPAHGQTASAPPLSFLGGGVGLGPRDIESRVAYPANRESFEGQAVGDAGRFFSWYIDGSWQLASRVGVGAEFMVLEPARGVLRGGGYAITELQEERVLTGLARFRLTTSPRAAVDVVGGGGLLFWQRSDETTVSSPQLPQASESRERSSADVAVAAGLDAQFSVARHLSVVVGGRLLWLRRETLTVSDNPQEPSVRALLTVGLRAGR